MFAGTKQIWWSLQRSMAARASARCPLCTGSKVPPKSPIFMKGFNPVSVQILSEICKSGGRMAVGVLPTTSRLCSTGPHKMNSCNYHVLQSATRMGYMRVTLPLLRIAPARAPILRYGVAVLSTALALIPTILLADVSESRLALFGVAVMVSAWYGGWKPGIVATAFALTVCAYFSLVGEHTPDQLRTAILRLSLFFFLAMLICWLNAALRAAQENLRKSELNFRSLVTHAPYGICRCDGAGKMLDANPAFLELLGYAGAEQLVGE